MRALLPLAVAILLSGCSSPEAGAGQEMQEPSATENETSFPPAPMPPVARPVSFAWSGHTKEGTWVCMEQDGLGQCMAGQQVAPDQQHVTALAYAGNATAIEITMTWQADATQTGLVLAVYANRTAGFALLDGVQGDSPLALALDLAGADLPADGSLVLMVWPEGKTPTSPSLFVDATQQAFTVEGVVWQDG